MNQFIKKIKEIEDRTQKATDGGWNFVPIQDSLEYFIVGEDGREAVAGNVFTANDANFIAHARQDIPILLEHISKQTEEIDTLKLLNNMSEKSIEDDQITKQRLADELAALENEKNQLLEEMKRI
ncbi:hypothetical protein [Oceanobacillus kimchii]|uniref:Uncharacterized protein n=1 Tax=Oceanobacillus kimchii TaxID=746691 RepID=A0ABQ5TM68_9BACI|nr:hypothetical protein [Oceanobacillus kimchii]GLO66205.1 hypothetical protein MACH08_19890 [Oceanobacillus kimchii]